MAAVFGNCPFFSFTSVSIPDSVTSIGYSAFNGCSGLNEVHISDLAAWCGIEFSGGDVNPLYYAHHLFMDGQEVTELKIPSGVTSIGGYAFYRCQKLTSINIPDSVTLIEWAAFSDCSGLTSIAIGNGVTSIGDYAFAFCSGLTELKVNPNNQTYHVQDNCLIETQSKTLIVGCKTSKIPNDGSVTSIGEGAFSGCSELTSIDIPDSVTSIGGSAFSDCSGLTSVTIGSGVTSIKSCAFSGCDGLQSVTFRDPNGWSCDNSEVDVTILQNAAAAADYVKSHDESSWTKRTGN